MVFHIEGNDIINHHGSGLTSTIPGPYKSSQGIKWSCTGDHKIIMVKLDKDALGINPAIASMGHCNIKTRTCSIDGLWGHTGSSLLIMLNSTMET